MRVAINGFGRIGRLVLRAAQANSDIEIVAVNDITDAKTLAHLLIYDSIHGNFPKVVHAKEGALIVNEREIAVLAERDPAKLPWKRLGVDMVVESTGLFTTKEAASKHLDAGARRVIVSAPCKGKDPMKTIVMGVNHEMYDPEKDTVVSNASCTTNCLAPMAKVLHEAYGIEHGFMLTAHSYTGDQALVDGPHRDLRRARAAAINLIPTTTGAASAIGEVIPALKGKLDGLAIRVPTPDASLTDLTVRVNRDATVQDVNEAFGEQASNGMLGVLEYIDEPLVSSDIIGNPHSAVFDSLLTMVVDRRLVKVLAWYDNEWGYANRIVDLLMYMDKLKMRKPLPRM